MKIYALSIVLTPEGGSAKVLNSASDLSSFSFYQRGTISEFLTFFSGLVAERTQPGERQSFTDVDKQDSEYVFHVYNRGGDERLAGNPYPSSLFLSSSTHLITHTNYLPLPTSRHGL